MDNTPTWKIGLVVVGAMALLAAGTYLHEQSTHGPFSGDEYLTRELVEARAIASDAVLLSVSATCVKEDGQIQAAFSDGRYWHNCGSLATYFRSASHGTKQKPKEVVPLGAPALHPDDSLTPPSKCPSLRVSAGLHGSGKQTHFGIETDWREEKSCDDPLPGPVHCRLGDIWKRAISAGAPHPAYADLYLYALNATATTATWHFTIHDHNDHNKLVFEGRYPDDCRE